MVLIERIIGCRLPDKMLLASKRALELYRCEKGGCSLQKRSENGNINSESLKEIFRKTGDGSAGILLTGENYIFNIIGFEKLPYKSIQRNEMVEWRLSKVFPGDLSRFDHQVLTLGRKSVLSVLLPLSKKVEITHAFKEADIKEIYIGNSFIEFCGRCCKNNQNSLMIELEDDYCLVGFGQPLRYIRKLIVSDPGSMVDELGRTAEYIKKVFKREIADVNILDLSTRSGEYAFDYFSKSLSMKCKVMKIEDLIGGMK